MGDISSNNWRIYFSQDKLIYNVWELQFEWGEIYRGILKIPYNL